MFKRKILALTLATICGTAIADTSVNISLEQIGRFETGVFDESAAEIVAYDQFSKRLFVINANDKSVDVLDITNPAAPTLTGMIDVAVDIADAGGVNSVAVHDGLVAIAVEHDNKQQDGYVAFYDTDGNYITNMPAGALPDMVTFSPDGRFVVVANEGEPSSDYSNDPEGSITVIDLKKGLSKAKVKQANFRKFNKNYPVGVRISGPNASVSQDLEPEYITVSTDSSTAYVTLQENNAFAIVDLKSAQVQKLVPMGNKDHSMAGYGLDASNRDDAINIQPWPVLGTYMPDSVASYEVMGRTFLITANEGDGREYIYEDVTEAECESAGHEYDDGDCISHLDEVRIKDIELNPAVFLNADVLQEDENLGRLKIIATEGDFNNDGAYEELHSYGARSITIWDEQGKLVADTGDTIEQVTAALNPDGFNSTNDENDSFDDRSDDKGPEPEGVTVGEINGQIFAFVGLERVGGIMIFDVSEPVSPRYVSYINNRDFSVGDVEEEDAGDLGPEGLLFIPALDSPNGEPLLVVGSEVSGSTTIYQIVGD